MLPHLDAAYNLARWLTGNETDAADVVQDAYVRALQFHQTFRGGDSRAWILKIVRNTAYTWLGRNRPTASTVPFDETAHGASEGIQAGVPGGLDRAFLLRALKQLPLEFREPLVLREIEGLAYKEIANIVDIPIGTVMSRLSRARRMLRDSYLRQTAGAAEKGQSR